MENITEKTAIGVLVIALLSIGVTIMPEDTHYSNCLNVTMHCERLSSTELTCYPHTDDRKGSKYSECGWIPIIEYSVSATKQYTQSDGEWVCNHDGCIIL